MNGLFTERFFEHIDYREEAPEFLREVLRVLEPGGAVRIVVPDAELYFRAYCEPGWQKMKQLRSPFGGGMPDDVDVQRTKCELVNDHLRQEGQHKFSYDFETLSRLLHRCGFSHIERMEFGISQRDPLCLDSELRANRELIRRSNRGK